jgi:hypothetical protein
LNDLNARLSNISTTYSDKELVIAASLNDLNSRLKALEDNAALFENGENN